MAFPDHFTFNQSNLQDYLDCQRRFELRYLLKIRWPALQTEPVIEREQQMRLGQKFHQMVQQYFSGIPAETLAAQIQEDQLNRWWSNFINAPFLNTLPALVKSETTLAVKFSEYRLLAKYDLLAIDPEGRISIYDWKTSLNRPKSSNLRKRMQSRVYPLVLSLAGQNLLQNQPIQPEQIDMVYWFPEYPDRPEKIEYTQLQFEKDQKDLSSMISEIHNLPSGKFMLTPEEQLCQFCEYRSLCNRGVKAANWTESDEDPTDQMSESLQIDFDQIGEIAF
jgi:hypothetical protein